MNTKPPIKCIPCRVTYEHERYQIEANGEVRSVSDLAMSLGCDTTAIKFETVRSIVDIEPEQFAKKIRQEASRQRRNRNARERYQAHKDLGLIRTPSGQWE